MKKIIFILCGVIGFMLGFLTVSRADYEVQNLPIEEHMSDKTFITNIAAAIGFLGVSGFGLSYLEYKDETNNNKR